MHCCNARSICIGQAAFRLDDGNGLTGRDQDVCAPAPGMRVGSASEGGSLRTNPFLPDPRGFLFRDFESRSSRSFSPPAGHQRRPRRPLHARARTAGAKLHDIGGGCDGVGAWLRGGGGGSAARKRRGGPTHARLNRTPVQRRGGSEEAEGARGVPHTHGETELRLASTTQQSLGM
jgi:hypothetical protein